MNENETSSLLAFLHGLKKDSVLYWDTWTNEVLLAKGELASHEQRDGRYLRMPAPDTSTMRRWREEFSRISTPGDRFSLWKRFKAEKLIAAFVSWKESVEAQALWTESS